MTHQRITTAPFNGDHSGVSEIRNDDLKQTFDHFSNNFVFFMMHTPIIDGASV